MSWLPWILVNCLLICSLTDNCVYGARVRRVVGGVPADIPPADDPVVYVRHKGKFASVEGIRDPDTYQYHFRGLRFAHAPTGKQRFQRPRPYTLEGEVNATQYPPPCMQPQPGTDNVIGSEDCLFLNVFTPDLPDGTEGLPVIVWIHGGGFRYGSASQYNVHNLVRKRVVLVTIQYRLSSLGFLSIGDEDMPGNTGLFDMALAVQWTRNYIGFFGGNPHKITVMGQGSGASSALLLSLSNIARGLASAVVAMSGTAVSHWAIDNEPRKFVEELADRHGCPTTNVLVMINCLRSIPAADIIREDSAIESIRLRARGFISGLSGLLTPSPVNEGKNDGRSLPGFIEMNPLDSLTGAFIPNIPLLTGVTRDETGNAVNGQYQAEIKKKLGSVPQSFLDNVLVHKLQETIAYTVNKSEKPSFWSIVDPLNFTSYLKVGKNNIKEAFSKISEATGDVLFNLPAFVTADYWSKKNNSTFLYRFEHIGKSFKGYHFLQGMPLIGNVTKQVAEDLVSHGDDLGYLFSPQAIDGSPLALNVTDTVEDERVRDVFTDMIYSFVKSGTISVQNKPAPHFTDAANNYISVTAQPKILKDFRFCQIGLWAGIAERLQTSTCRVLSVITDTPKILIDTVKKNDGGAIKILGDNAQKLTGTLSQPFETNKDIKSAKNPLSGIPKPKIPNILG